MENLLDFVMVTALTCYFVAWIKQKNAQKENAQFLLVFFSVMKVLSISVMIVSEAGLLTIHLLNSEDYLVNLLLVFLWTITLTCEALDASVRN